MLKILRFSVGLSVIISLISIGSLALAREGNWLEVTQPQSSNRIFIDVNSIKREPVTGDVKYKIRNVYSKPTSTGVARSRSTYLAYCNSNMQRLSELTTYNRSNRILESITYGAQTKRGDFRNLEAPLEQVTSESVSYAAFKYACSR
ncbi:MAG: hypothetical protein M3O33_03080 [Cyanobacteriota bacterium]|jgi:hypothetical protein|nr:hypothetical protein [Cyanobacteriota bacterium]